MINVLHITTHLGGGVGRIISSLALYRKTNAPKIRATIISLEETENAQYSSVITDAGIPLHIAPNTAQLDALIAAADIVQIEWWHQPLMMAWLIDHGNAITTRLVIWSHISGLHYPIIPQKLLELPHAFLFTSPISQQAMLPHPEQTSSTLYETVHSAAEFDALQYRVSELSCNNLSFSYMGTLNPGKLHPDIVEFIAAVDHEGFQLHFYGDPCPSFPIDKSADAQGIGDRVVLHGYSQQPQQVLSTADVFVYLLNPEHYGTTENVLLEAMVSGAVPIVMNNPVESSIVHHGESGLVVDSPERFAQAIEFLYKHPHERIRMADNARRDVLSRYSLENSCRQLTSIYKECLQMESKPYNFTIPFGSTPFEWYSSCLGELAPLVNDPTGIDHREERRYHAILYEQTKSSVFHYLRYFPDDPDLKHLSEILEADIASATHC